MRSFTIPWTVVVLVGGCLAAALALGTAPREETAGHASGPEYGRGGNVLLVIIDDVGAEKVGAYGMHENAGPTPTIDALCARGVRFETAWATPYCSPTRSAILTGRLPSRTGIGAVVMSDSPSPGLSLDETLLPEALKAVGPDQSAPGTALIGKWHLCGLMDDNSHPLRSGFDVFTGTRSNLRPRKNPRAYFGMPRIVNGRSRAKPAYMTTVTTDDALDAIQGFGEQPWFVVVSYHAAHFPLHAPPKELHSFDLKGDPQDSPVQHHKASVEAMDREIGRLLGSLPEGALARTSVVVIGDNGTQRPALAGPFADRTGKGSLGEAGIRVPLVIAGPTVQAPGRVHGGLVHAVDLFPTILELMGAAPSTPKDGDKVIDGVSLAPVLRGPTVEPGRSHIYTELFKPNHAPVEERTSFGWAIRSATHKLVVRTKGGAPELFDLVNDPTELLNLLAADEPTPESLRIAKDLTAARDRLELD